MVVTRRDWLKTTGTVATAVALTGLGGGCGEGDESDALPNNASRIPTPELESYVYDGPLGPEGTFTHGVASGDPLPDAVVIWTRVSPESAGDVDVFYEVSIDAEFEQRVAADWLVAAVAADNTVKHDVTGLAPSSTLYYRFHALGRISPIGRLRTAPKGGVKHLRFGVASCSSLAHGYFHVYGNLAKRADLEAVLHLGDYIYEYGSDPEGHVYGTARPCEPTNELFTLADYRMRYAQYRREAPLQELHRQHPMIHVWDDHEIADNTWVNGSGTSDTAPVPFPERKAAAMQAYSEWMPTRMPAPDPMYRKFVYGDLIDLFMLDTRNEGRSKQVGSAASDTPERTLLGFEQEEWLQDGLVDSSAQWRILGQQVMMVPITPLGGLFFDGWEGYPAARDRLLSFVESKGISNIVVLTGDIHTSWANEIPRSFDTYDAATGAGSLAVEFVTPAVSSPGLASNGLVKLVYEKVPTVHYSEHMSRGCIVLDVTRGAVQADWYYAGNIEDPADTGETHAKSFAVYSGESRLVELLEPVLSREAPPFAP